MPNYGYISSYENAISLAYLYVQYIITKVIELKQKRVGDEFMDVLRNLTLKTKRKGSLGRERKGGQIGVTGRLSFLISLF